MNSTPAMRIRRRSAATIEFDTFGVGVGLAVIVGALSLLAPYLDALTAALAALALAGWAAGRSHDRRFGRTGDASLRVVGVAGAAAGAVAFLLLPGSTAGVRGLVLGLALVPLWLIERRAPPGSKDAAIP